MESMWMNKALIMTLALTSCFVACHAQVCGRMEYSDSVGYVSSPGFPNNYAHNLDCTYNLRAYGQTSLTIFYETIDLEVYAGCGYDWVQIRCSSDVEITRTICQLGEERVISYASCNHAVIRFRTDSSNTGKGFRFYYAFQRVSSTAPPTTRQLTTSTKRTTLTPTTRRTTLAPTTEDSSTSLIVTDSNDFLSNIVTAIGPNTSAMLILVLAGLLALSLFFVLALIIVLNCRSKQSRVINGLEPCRQQAPNQSTEHYSLDPTGERGGQRDERAGCNNSCETYFDEDIYERPDDGDDDYENADEIDTGKIGRY